MSVDKCVHAHDFSVCGFHTQTFNKQQAGRKIMEKVASALDMNRHLLCQYSPCNQQLFTQHYIALSMINTPHDLKQTEGCKQNTMQILAHFLKRNQASAEFGIYGTSQNLLTPRDNRETDKCLHTWQHTHICIENAY